MELVQPLAIAVGLGLLVGLEREWSDDEEIAGLTAGIRTFPLITALGVICAALAARFDGWILATGALAVAGFFGIENALRRPPEGGEHGLTTEIAALVMYGVGAILVVGETTLAIVLGGAVAVLLHWKGPLHSLVDRLGKNEVQGVFRLALVGLVILPLLPDRAYGPYGVLNPYEIWFVVVLVVGISLAGWLAYRAFGHRKGSVIAGLLGGLISSTATTFAFARRTKRSPDSAPTAALVVMLASTVVFARVIVEVGVIDRSLLREFAPPLAAMLGVMALISLLALFRKDVGAAELEPEGDPAQLKAAVSFGLLYAFVLLAVAFAKERFQEEGLYVVAVVSGLTDVDAITLSVARLAKAGAIESGTGWRLVLVGALSNLVFKGGVVMVLGGNRMRKRALPLFLLATLAGGALLVFWP